MKNISKILISMGIAVLMLSNVNVFSSAGIVDDDIETIELHFLFSEPTYDIVDDELYAYVEETDLNVVVPGRPVLPANITTLQLPFGSEIVSVSYECAEPLVIPLYGLLALVDDKSFQFDTDVDSTYSGAFEGEPSMITQSEFTQEMYPEEWISYHTGGGIYDQQHVTHFVLRVFPLQYDEAMDSLRFIEDITVTVEYRQPEDQILDRYDIYDLLVVTTSKFEGGLSGLVEHKESIGVKTYVATTTEIYDEMFWYGRDEAESIKQYIRHAVEYWGVSHVLLVGGLDGQSGSWNIPARRSYVVPQTEQEYPEQSFISDLYYADLYFGDGSFCSWDSNDDWEFSVWNETYHEHMDLYPDVYLGRIPCRDLSELRIMVDKIITYESETYGAEWFDNYLIVAGDSYDDVAGYNEGELIGEYSIPLFPGCTPLRVYASMDDISRSTVNSAFNQGCGFAYFCGHGSPGTWSTHFPPDGTEWTSGYSNNHMRFLRNGYKMPIVFIGGCHNGQFDVGLYKIREMVGEFGILGTFFASPYKFFYNEWRPNCWAWEMTSMRGGGAIASIGNTGLGTHGDGDLDRNGVADYLEVLDGWLELRFLEMYGVDGCTDLGENHGDAMTEYIHRFLGNDAIMDTKMVQQWELFGDPTLVIGGIDTESIDALD